MEKALINSKDKKFRSLKKHSFRKTKKVTNLTSHLRFFINQNKLLFINLLFRITLNGIVYIIERDLFSELVRIIILECSTFQGQFMPN